MSFRKQAIRGIHNILFLVCLGLLFGPNTTYAGEENIQLPEGFELTVIASGFNFGTDMVFLPSDDILVTEKGTGAEAAGQARVRLVRNGVLQPTPVLTLSTNTISESGLVGIALDPDFVDNGYFYLWYATGEQSPGWAGATVNRLSRFTFDETTGTADPESELILLDGVGWSRAHNGGGVLFDDDGLLYLSIGDREQPQQVQSRSAINGTVIRIRPTEAGYEVPEENPFVGEPDVPPEIYAFGLRNPFRLTRRLSDGAIFIADVGEAEWEELNRLEMGANYGWAVREGPCPRGHTAPCDPASTEFTEPVLYYPHPPDAGGAITGMAFYEGDQFPEKYQGKLFFTDFDQGYVAVADLNEPDRATVQAGGTYSFTIETFTNDLGAVVDLAYHKGNLYALNASTARIEMIHYVGGDNRIPSARLSAAPVLGPSPLTVTFSAEKSTDVDDVVLQYHWDWGDGSEPLVTSTPVVSHTYAADGTYTAGLKVVDARGGESNVVEQDITVYSGEVPSIELENLVEPGRELYHGGDRIRFEAERETGMGDLDPEAPYTWRIDWHHNQHAHPELRDFVGSAGFLDVPTDNHGGDWNLWYRFYLTMKTESGQEVQVHRDLRPAHATLHVALHADGQPVTETVQIDTIERQTPLDFKAIAGTVYEFAAPEELSVAGKMYNFDQWHIAAMDAEDGGERFSTRQISVTIPVSNTVYVAHYSPSPQHWIPYVCYWLCFVAALCQPICT